MFEWLKTFSYYSQWQSEKSQRRYYEALCNTWKAKALESDDQIKTLKAALSECVPQQRPVVTPTKTRTTRGVQDIILDKLGGRGFSMIFEDADIDSPTGRPWKSAPIQVIINTIIPYIQRYMTPWKFDVPNCNNKAMFMASACGEWFGLNCIHPLSDRPGKHMYCVIVPAEDELWIHEPDRYAGLGTFTTKFEDFTPTFHYSLNGGYIYGF